MHTIPKTGAATVALLALALASWGCSVEVRDHDSDGRSDVEIHTPAGQLSVHSLDDARETGLAVYPGAWPLSRRHGRDSANVDISTAWFGVKVAAARFETDDDHSRVVDFYRRELAQYGEVTECHGDVRFRGPHGARHAVCRDGWSSRDVELVVGTEENQRVVSVKSHGDYTEFALAHVFTRGS